MGNVIEKLTQSLDKKIEETRHSLINDMLNKILEPSSLQYHIRINSIAQKRNIKRIINIPKELWQEHNELFISFDELSNVLEKSNLKTREKFEIIMLIFEKNLSTDILNKGISAFNTPLLANYPFKYTTPEEAINLIEYNKYQKLNKNNLSPLDQLKLEEIKKAVEEKPLDFSNIIKLHKIIKEHYFDKYPNIEQEDFDFITKVLKEFELTPNLLKEINAYFISILENKKRKQETNNIKIQKKTSQTPIISKKEYYILNKKLKEYYDLDNNTTIRELSLKEQIICIHLLQKMNINKEKINKILHKINKLSSKHSIAIYTRMHDKFNYYKNNKEIATSLNELDNYFSKIFICDDVDYEILKMCFEDELNKILELIPNTYDYEYEKAKTIKLSK